MRWALAGALALGACSAAALHAAAVDGQLFCSRASRDGALTVAIADAAGVPVIVSGLASSVVQADCALIDGIPVTPPADPAAVPVVAVAAK